MAVSKNHRELASDDLDKPWRCPGHDPFCLGMGDHCGCRYNKKENVTPNTSPEPSKKKLKLSLQKPQFDLVDDEEMSSICKGYIPLLHVLRYMRYVTPSCPNILIKQFHALYGACKVVLRLLHQSGVGADVKHSAMISVEEEDELWSSGAINQELQRSVFYYVGKIFCIRGGDKQRNLRPSQFARSHNPACYIRNSNMDQRIGLEAWPSSTSTISMSLVLLLLTMSRTALCFS